MYVNVNLPLDVAYLCVGCYLQVTRLSQVTIGKLSIGHIVNLSSNDVQRFDLVS